MQPTLFFKNATCICISTFETEDKKVGYISHITVLRRESLSIIIGKLHQIACLRGMKHNVDTDGPCAEYVYIWYDDTLHQHK